MTPQELKNSILQLAIQGKLVEQRPEEGTAEELYQQIQTEKRALVKAGKIKKEKPLPEITEDEKPFDIPESWMWVRVSDCISNRAGLAYDKGNLDIHSDNMIRVLRGGNITEMGYSSKPDDIMISAEFVKPELFLRRNMIITPAVTSLDHVGKMGRIEADYDNMVVGGFVLMLTPHINEDTFSRYLLCAFSSKYFRDRCRGIVNKSGQAFYNLSRGKMMEIVIPLPPLAEQKRIVAKIEELLPLIDRYEKAWSRLEDFNKRFPGDMQKSFLQLAIQGKLVEQRPEEGTGEELFKKLEKHHDSLKPCKDELNLSFMDFDIPDNWRMVELNQLFDFVDYRGKTPNKISEGVFLITASNIKQGYMDYTRKEYISHEEYEGRKNRGITKSGDLLFTTEAPMGNAALCDLDICSCGQRIITFQPYEDETVIPKLYMYFILSPAFQGQLLDNCTGTTAKGIKADKLKHLLIPLPPLAEQKRIVAKLEELLPLCDRLK